MKSRFSNHIVAVTVFVALAVPGARGNCIARYQQRSNYTPPRRCQSCTSSDAYQPPSDSLGRARPCE